MVVYFCFKMIGLIGLLGFMVKELEVDECFSLLGYYIAQSYTRRKAFSSTQRDKLKSRTNLNSVQLKLSLVVLNTSNEKPDG
jgi:hypothetical protein